MCKGNVVKRENIHAKKRELDLSSTITTYDVQIDTTAQHFFRKIVSNQNKKDI